MPRIRLPYRAEARRLIESRAKLLPAATTIEVARLPTLKEKECNKVFSRGCKNKMRKISCKASPGFVDEVLRFGHQKYIIFLREMQLAHFFSLHFPASLFIL
jgi:hypothetical protein